MYRGHNHKRWIFFRIFFGIVLIAADKPCTYAIMEFTASVIIWSLKKLIICRLLGF